MIGATNRFGWYLAVLQLFFTLCWTVYAIYLPKLAADANIAPGAIIWLLMLDQAIFTVCDFATGVAADKVTRVLGRLGIWVAVATALSCTAFLALPFVAVAGPSLFIAVTLVWTITSSALRSPPLMLLGKYAAKPLIPYLSSLAMLGYGIAGALAPYLTITLRDLDPRWPFALASFALALTTLGMISAERRLAITAEKVDSSRSMQPFPSWTKVATLFALAMILLAFGYQVYFSLESASLFLRFAPPEKLQWLMPIFWIGFNIAMFPASILTRRFGGFPIIGMAGLVGALAIVAAYMARDLQTLILAQLIVGSAWGVILMSAFSAAFAIGENGREGRMSGVVFSALALATFVRMTMVAIGLTGETTMIAGVQWLPTLCWGLVGFCLLHVAARVTLSSART
jgi:hypothetical protein